MDMKTTWINVKKCQLQMLENIYIVIETITKKYPPQLTM